MTALREQIGRLLDDVSRRVGPAAADIVNRLDSQLDEPLTIAVAGRTNAGKSTLVNALIGTRIAPTASTECTRAVTWFRAGPHQSRVVYADGSEDPLWLTDDGRLPDRLRQPPERVERLDVWVNYEPLHDITVIDTPGLSGDEGLADQTERLLKGGHADVLLFVFGATIRADEHQIVSDYRARTSALYDFPGNTHGILSRADQFLDPDPWAKAEAVAAEHAAALSDELAGVLPIMGKLAETTETGSFAEDHASWLRTVAALPAAERDNALRRKNTFKNYDVLTDAARSSLLERLDIYGIRELTAPENADLSADVMYETLRTRSGIAALQKRLRVMFVRPAAVHKAVRVLTRIEEFVRQDAQAGEMREDLLDQIQVIRDSPAMHTLAELRALAALYAGRSDLGDPIAMRRALLLFEETEAWRQLDCESADADLAEIALDAARYWKSYANKTADLLATSIAETASTSAYLIHTSIRSPS